MAGLIQIEPNRQDQDKLLRRLKQLAHGLSPGIIDQVMRTDVHPLMKNRISDRFDAEGDTTVGQWAPLSDATQDIRYSMGYDPEHPINERTGQLRRFVENSYQMTKRAGSVEMAIPGTFTNPTLEDKFRKAQQGKAPRSKNVTVPRPVVAIGQVENDIVTDRMKLHVEKILQRP